MKNNLDGNICANASMSIENSATSADATAHDVVVTDLYVWGVSSGIMSTLKTFADAGAVVWSTGNDTTTNVFVTDVNSIGTENVYTGTTFANASDYLGVGTTTVTNTSSDPASYINTYNTSLNIIPLYYHNFVGSNAIMGYLYVPDNNNGGSLFFDEFGYVAGHAANRV
jgi:hypothetical protein